MKKDFFPTLPFVLGISAMILAIMVAVTVAIAVPCNDRIPSEYKENYLKCNSYIDGRWCHDIDSDDCESEMGRASVLVVRSIYSYTNTAVGNKNDHAVWNSLILCGYMYHCKTGMYGTCFNGEKAIVPGTNEYDIIGFATFKSSTNCTAVE